MSAEPVSAPASSDPPSFFLEFSAIQTEPHVERIFLTTGGAISAAASRNCTDFAVTGSRTSTREVLTDKFASSVRVELSPDHVRVDADSPMTVVLSNRSKLMVGTSRLGSAINGTIVTTNAGQNAQYLSSLLRAGNASPSSIGLKYASWEAHTAVVSMSNFKIVDSDRREYSVRFVKDDTHEETLQNAQKILEAWADGSWKMRKASFVYPLSPSLTKSVAKVPVGINDSGYSPLHDFALANKHGHSYEAIDSLFEQAINADLEFVQEDVKAFLEDTASPGLRAAQRGGRSVAAAMSLIANVLVPYRADGRTAILPTGSANIAAEFWNFASAKDHLRGDDCDYSAGLSLGMLEAASTAPEDVRAKFPFVNAVYNVLNPHYMIGLTVLGASSAEASSGGGGGGGGGGRGGTHASAADVSDDADAEVAADVSASGRRKSVAGHAIALWVPTLDALRALERGAHQTIADRPIVAQDMQSKIGEARFHAIFTPEVVAAMPEEERHHFESWEAAKRLMDGDAYVIEALACEGTTPASPLLYRSGEAGDRARQTARLDKLAFKKMGPTIGRSIKILHSGEDGEHRFYHDFVEFTLGRDHPLWKSEKVRELGAASTQFVFSKHDGRDEPQPVQAAGCTPEQVVRRSFAFVPLVVADTTTTQILDYASMHAENDSMPVGASTAQTLTDFQTKGLETSLGHLEKLNAALRANLDVATEDDAAPVGHAVAHTVSIASMVNNPNAIKHLCDRVEAMSVSGLVDSVPIKGLIVDAKGRDVGRLVVINSVVNV